MQRTSGNDEGIGYDGIAATFSPSPVAIVRRMNSYRTLPLTRPHNGMQNAQNLMPASSGVPELLSSCKRETSTVPATEFGRCCSYGTDSSKPAYGNNHGPLPFDEPEMLTTFRPTAPMPICVARRLRLPTGSAWPNAATTADQVWKRVTSDSFHVDNDDDEEDGAADASDGASARTPHPDDQRLTRPQMTELPNVCPPLPITTVSVPDLTMFVPINTAAAAAAAGTSDRYSPNSTSTNGSPAFSPTMMATPVTSRAGASSRSGSIAQRCLAAEEMTSSTDYLVPPAVAARLGSSAYGLPEDNDSSSRSS
jgi:hypothetical protein